MRKKPGRRVRSLLLLLVLAAGAYVAWGYLQPLLVSGTETVYERYTVQRGDVFTTKSFSASLNVRNSESHTYSGQEAGSIRKLYVRSGQMVQKDDKLLQLEDGTVYRAGIAGVINEMRFGEGDWVWRNVPLVQVVDLEHLQVALQVDEYDVDKVAVGQKCTVTLVALGLDFETEISHVNRVASTTGGVAYYDVTAELTVPENVLPGMTASVSIPSDEARDVPVLELAAFSFDEAGEPYVLIQNGESYERRSVQVGLNDGMYAQITDGLAEGDVVYRAHEQESTAAAFSLAALYKRIVGETVVINERDGAGRGMNMPNGQPMPGGQPAGRPQQAGGGRE